jgi:hypothetical protein
MKKILYILLFCPLFCNGQSYLAKSVNGTNADATGNVTIEVGGAQTLSRTFSDSISLSISGGNTVKLPYAVDSVGATSDSIIVYKFGIRKSYTNGASGGASLSGLTVATATNAINNANYKQRWSWNTIGADTALVLNSTSTQANSNLQTVLAVTQSGANANSTQSTFGIKISNLKTGTSATNVGLDIVCSGGSTNNAINIQSGRLQMNNNVIYWSNGTNITELASSFTVASQTLNINTSLGSVGQALGINSGGYNQFSVGMCSSYNAPFMALGGASWNGGTTFYSYGTNSIIFKDIAGDLALMQDASLTYATTFTPTERFRFKVDGSVGVGTASPNASALMDLTSTARGFLPPRMTTTQRDAISTPAAGLIIYNTTTNKLNVFTTTWEVITSL